MDARDIGWCVGASGAELAWGEPSARVSGIGTDSRQVQAGQLFVALRGDRFDGHDFVAAVAARGVAGVMVSGDWDGLAPAGVAVLRVGDTRAALGRMASVYRGELGATLVAVAGSNGKTTTKELIAWVVRGVGPVWRSAASFNNDVGVPLSLLAGSGADRVGVLEVGTNHPGELAPLLRMVRPDVGVLTSIGREHLEYFGDEAGVAREEGFLAESLGPGGLLVLQGDTRFAGEIAGRSASRVTTFGWDAGREWRVAWSRSTWEGEEFGLEGAGGGWDGPWRVGVPGRVMASNATAALVVARHLGVGAVAAREALASFRAPARRMACVEAGGVRVLDDCYNANADSVASSLETFSRLPCAGRRVAVLGDMAELGEASEGAHEEAGLRAAAAVDVLLTVGRWAGVTARAARGAGLGRACEHEDVKGVLETLGGLLRPGDAMLVKASRSSRLERVTEGWLGAHGASGLGDGGGSC